MPRKKQPQTDMLESRDGTPIMPVLVTRHPAGGHRAREVDPYQAFEGGAPPQEKPPHKTKRKRRTKAEIESTELAIAQSHAKARENRTDAFLDAIIDTKGDKYAALALAFNLPHDQVVARYDELIEEIDRGLATSSIGQILERNHVSTQTRVKVLRKWLFSDVPAASLKAADMLADIDNRPQHQGPTYEHYVRIVMAED